MRRIYSNIIRSHYCTKFAYIIHQCPFPIPSKQTVRHEFGPPGRTIICAYRLLGQRLGGAGSCTAGPCGTMPSQLTPVRCPSDVLTAPSSGYLKPKNDSSICHHTVLLSSFLFLFLFLFLLVFISCFFLDCMCVEHV